MLTRQEADRIIENEHNARVQEEINMYLPELDRAGQRMLERMRKLANRETVDFPVVVKIPGATTPEARKYLLETVRQAGWKAEIDASREEIDIYY